MSRSPSPQQILQINRLHLCEYQTPQTGAIRAHCTSAGRVTGRRAPRCLVTPHCQRPWARACTLLHSSYVTRVPPPASPHGPHCPESRPCHGRKPFSISPRMSDSQNLLVLFPVVTQRAVPLWLSSPFTVPGAESPLGSLTITSLPAPLLGHSISSDSPVLSESPGILTPQ